MHRKHKPSDLHPIATKTTYEVNTSLIVFLRALARTPDGILLIILVALFLLATFIPSVALLSMAGYCPGQDINEMRLAFFFMPLVLTAEYVWFGIGGQIGQASALRVIVLVTTSIIPFIKCIG